MRWVRSDRFDEPDPVEVGHVQIGQDQVHRATGELRQRVLPVDGLDHLGQHQLDDLAQAQ